MQSNESDAATGTVQPRVEVTPWLCTRYCFLVASIGLGALVASLSSSPIEVSWLVVLVFTALSFLVQRLSFHLGSPVVHSLAGIIDAAAVLALGRTRRALVALFSGVAYLELSAIRHRQ